LRKYAKDGLNFSAKKGALTQKIQRIPSKSELAAKAAHTHQDGGVVQG